MAIHLFWPPSFPLLAFLIFLFLLLCIVQLVFAELILGDFAFIEYLILIVFNDFLPIEFLLAEEG